jgi:hypothetical protein
VRESTVVLTMIVVASATSGTTGTKLMVKSPSPSNSDLAPLVVAETCLGAIRTFTVLTSESTLEEIA